jgi:predicted nuclease of predicted toxin-antitoxin system
MKFLVDAHLPKSLANFLRSRGFDTIHTSELPNGNDMEDTEINRISIDEQRIVMSKDSDFYDSFTGKKEPYKLLHIKTGNIRNSELIELLDKNLLLIIHELNSNSVVQINQTYIISVF